MIEHTKFPYDLNLPENTQAYRGLAGEYPQSDRAILETQGMVLEYKGEIFPSFFYTQCGGYTEEASVLWPSAGATPHATRCEPCLKNQNMTWKFWMRDTDLREKLVNAGYKIPRYFQMILHRNPKTQRMMFVQIGEQHIPAHKLRNILGVRNIKSTFFWVKKGRYSMRFYGRGWGHGVGLCQSGAIQLAEEGYLFSEILKYYYPKSRCIDSQ
jgi:stage II sporulation protein D